MIMKATIYLLLLGFSCISANELTDLELMDPQVPPPPKTDLCREIFRGSCKDECGGGEAEPSCWKRFSTGSNAHVKICPKKCCVNNDILQICSTCMNGECAFGSCKEGQIQVNDPDDLSLCNGDPNGNICCVNDTENPCESFNDTCILCTRRCKRAYKIGTTPEKQMCEEENQDCCLPKTVSLCEKWGGQCKKKCNPCRDLTIKITRDVDPCQGETGEECCMQERNTIMQFPICECSSPFRKLGCYDSCKIKGTWQSALEPTHIMWTEEWFRDFLCSCSKEAESRNHDVFAIESGGPVAVCRTAESYNRGAAFAELCYNSDKEVCGLDAETGPTCCIGGPRAAFVYTRVQD